jgi:hypothetical protein
MCRPRFDRPSSSGRGEAPGQNCAFTSLGLEQKNGGWCRHQPPIPESFPPASPKGPASCPPSGGFGPRISRPKPRLRVPGSPSRARRRCRFAAWAPPREDLPELPFGIRHRPGERTPERPFCRARGRRSPPHPRRRLRSSRPSLALANQASGGGRPARVRIGETLGTAVSVRVPFVPPGFCRGCRARLGRGFHLAAAVAAASSAALALYGAAPEGACRSGRALDPFVRFRSTAPGHTRKLSPFPSRRKGKVPVDYEDNGDGMNQRPASGWAAAKAGWAVASASARSSVG